MDRWAGVPIRQLQAELGLPRLVAFGTTTSTNDAARALAEDGAPHGTMVLAEHQTAGRGRHGRAWADRAGAALLLSVVLRDSQGSNAATGDGGGALPLLVGLACARACAEVTRADIGVEWPNDLVAGDRKLGGILCEAASRARAVDFVVAGIGINVLGLPDQLPPEVRDAATSLERLGIAAAGDDARVRLLRALAPRLLSLTPRATLGPGELDALRSIDSLAGRHVRIDDGRHALALGILSDGTLALQDGDERFTLRAGSVSPLEPRHT